jgi:hypothetical protein
VFSEVAPHLDIGIELRDQGSVRTGHGVRVRRDENLGPGQIRPKGQTNGLRAVAGVDIAPTDSTSVNARSASIDGKVCNRRVP